ncbi:MAG TPA: TIGR03435 family protein [Candidatus Limnocylindrales bacterium]|nr:TIGR03435 family protein [Candidatus Limnocylindrales bacterium]
MRAIPVILLAAVAGIALSSQEVRPAFEVISIKPSAMQDGQYGVGLATFPGGRIRANEVTLDYFIEEAFDMQSYQIAGGPPWLHDDRWDMEAKPPEGSQASKSNPKLWKLPPNADQRLMMQSLLADRFHMRWHRETREGPVYFLVKTGKLKLRDAKDKEQYPWVGWARSSGPGLWGLNATMLLLTKRLSEVIHRPIIDRTGLDGAFDFDFKLDKTWNGWDPQTFVLAAVQGIGLKLETGKGPVETIVIDSIEKPAKN